MQPAAGNHPESRDVRPAMWLCILTGAAMGFIGGSLCGAAFGYALAPEPSNGDRASSAFAGLWFGALPGIPFGMIAAMVYGAIGGWKGAMLSGLAVGLLNPFLWLNVVSPVISRTGRPGAPDLVLGLLPLPLGVVLALLLHACYRFFVSTDR